MMIKMMTRPVTNAPISANIINSGLIRGSNGLIVWLFFLVPTVVVLFVVFNGEEL